MSVIAAPLPVNNASFSFGSDVSRERMASVVVTSGLQGGRGEDARGESLSSLYLGGVDSLCRTCRQPPKLCPGHAGVLPLNTPVQHPLTMTDTLAWLKIICLKCGASLLRPEAMEEIHRTPRSARLALAKERVGATPKPCPECKAVHPKVEQSPDDHVSFRADGRLYLPGEIRAAFDRISPALVWALAPDLRQHPRNLLIGALPIATTKIRLRTRIPSLPDADNYGDLTIFYSYVLMNNQKVPADLGGRPVPEPELENKILVMNDALHALLVGANANAVGKKRTLTQGSGQPNSSLIARLKRKQGRIRQGILGARTWLLSRSTISGNPDLGQNEVGIPIRFAKTAEVEERVTAANVRRLTAIFLQRDPAQYPRCRRVKRRQTGRYHDVTRLPDDVFLEVGDVVVRDAVDGDLAFFNRMPSLTRSAITVLRLVVLRDPAQTTFQMNVTITPLFNADFNTIGV